MSKKNGRFVWDEKATKGFRAAIKAKKETYSSIAKRLKIRPATVWAQLHKDEVKAWRAKSIKAAKAKANARAKARKAKAASKAPATSAKVA